MNKPNILIIIPARGGSKGIPRKNLRNLNNKPLIYYSIQNGLNSKYKPDVYVSSEDEEILSISKQFGAKIFKRGSQLSADDTTLDGVVIDAYQQISTLEKKSYDLVVTLQPTSPLLKTISLDNALDLMVEKQELDTVLSGMEDTHLSWKKENGKYLPNYKERLNRQYLPKEYRETGGFLIARKSELEKGRRIGDHVELYLLQGSEAIDIDNYEDWQICEYYLRKKRVLMVVAGNNEIGLGHVYRSLILANNILDHEVLFLVEKNSELAKEKIADNNYFVQIQTQDSIVDDIKTLHPDVVINDLLDTSAEYIVALKTFCQKVINFEDLGEGAKQADIVINALYPEDKMIKDHYFGHQYFIPRDEFLFTGHSTPQSKVKRVLITFGGTDPNNYTKKVIDAIENYCDSNDIKITVICGLGYLHYESISKHPKVKVLRNVSNISKYMKEADIIFSSAGRTVYEIACIGTPAIILAQNERELTHLFGSIENGFINLGLGYRLDNEKLLSEFIRLAEAYENRKKMARLMLSKDVISGKQRVLKLIRDVIESI